MTVRKKGKRGAAKKQQSWTLWVGGLIACLLLLIAVLAWNIWHAKYVDSMTEQSVGVVLHYTPPPVVDAAPKPAMQHHAVVSEIEPPAKVAAFTREASVASVDAGLSLIMDDMGYDVRAAKRLLALGVPLAISVLPQAPHAARVARLAHDAGQTVMLHLPMEPLGEKYRQLMDASFLKSGMNQQDMRQVMQADLKRVPFVQGVNNHMGSRLSSEPVAMQWVMQWCREHDLFFVDSLTSSHSVAAKVAKQYALRWGKRRIFLDDDVAPEAMQRSWQRVQACMKRQRRCIVIAHPHAETLAFLQHHVTQLKAWGMYPVTALLQ